MDVQLKLNDIETYIGQYHILQGVSLEVKKGEVTVLLGRNGAGKTTTLRTIMGLNPASKGPLNGMESRFKDFRLLKLHNRGIGYVPEDQGFFPYLTVEENMKVAMKANNKQQRNDLTIFCNCFLI